MDTHGQSGGENSSINPHPRGDGEGIERLDIWQLLAALPVTELHIPITETTVSPGTREILDQAGISTIGDLVRFTPERLRSLPGFTVTDEIALVKLLRELAPAGSVDQLCHSDHSQTPAVPEVQLRAKQAPASPKAGLPAMLLKCLQAVRDSDRTLRIILLRFGAHGHAYTFAEIGKKLKVSRSMVHKLCLQYLRQLERSIGAELRARITALLDQGSALLLEEIGARDPWFSGMSRLRAQTVTDPSLFIGELLEAVLRDVFVVTLNRKRVLCRLMPDEVEPTRRLCYEEVKNVEYAEEVESIVRAILRERGAEELTSLVVAELSQPDGQTSGGRWGLNPDIPLTAAEAVEHIMDKAARPLNHVQVRLLCNEKYHRSFSQEAIDRALQKHFLRLGKSTYGTWRHFRLSSPTVEALQKELAAVLGQQKFWSTAHIFDRLRQRNPALAARVDIYRLEIILNLMGGIRRTGKATWCTGTSVGDLPAAGVLDKQQSISAKEAQQIVSAMIGQEASCAEVRRFLDRMDMVYDQASRRWIKRPDPEPR